MAAAAWGSEEGMVSEIDGKRSGGEKGVLSGESNGGGARSHGLRLGRRWRDGVSLDGSNQG